MHSQNSSKSKKGGIPNLGKLEDIADYMIGEGGDGYVTDATSGSEVDTDAEVEVVERRARKIISKRQKERLSDDKKAKGRSGVEKRAVKLVELGPRMKLRMTKVEEGVCTGKVMWHEYINKSPEEMKELDRKWEIKRQQKAARQKVQKENVEKKKAVAKAQKPKKKSEEADDEEEDDDDEPMDVGEWDSEGLAGDGEMEYNEEMEDKGEWEDEQDEIAAG